MHRRSMSNKMINIFMKYILSKDVTAVLYWIMSTILVLHLVIFLMKYFNLMVASFIS